MRLSTLAASLVWTIFLGTSFAQRPCDEVISVATGDELRSMAEIFAQVFEVAGSTTDPEEIANAVEVFTSPILYDVAVSKVCASCEDTFSDAPPVPCEPGTYGANATYSALAFHPLDEDGRVLNGELNGQMSLLSTRLNLEDAPTIIYPASITQLLGETDFTYAGNDNGLVVALIDVYHSLMTASAGGIGMIFDNLGTGESEGIYDRSWGIKLPVQQGAIVTWKAVQDYTSAATDGCTVLQNRAFLYGYSLGAHHAMWSSEALREFLGVEVVQAFIQAGTYDIESLSAFSYFQQVNEDVVLEPIAALQSSVLLASYSNPDATYLPNAGTGEYWIADSWRNSSDISRNIPAWWFGGQEQNLAEYTSYLLPPEVRRTILNEAFAEASLASVAGGRRPCDEEFITEDIEFLCQAIRENADVYPLIFTTQFPIQTCHSPNDEVIPPLTTGILPNNGIISPYVPPFPFMEPNSNHVNSQVMCWGGANLWMQENPDFFEAVPIEEGIDGRNCSATPMPTVSPSASPSEAPSTSPVATTSAPTGSPSGSSTVSSPTGSVAEQPTPTGTSLPGGGSGTPPISADGEPTSAPDGGDDNSSSKALSPMMSLVLMVLAGATKFL